MGILQEGEPLTWQEIRALTKHVQKHGVQQFINLYRKSKDRHGDPFKWGDEIEYIIVKFNDAKKEAKVSCKAEELLTILNVREENNKSAGLWRPEYGDYLLESSPTEPFEGSFAHFKTVEEDMRRRREEVQQLLEKDECIMTLVNSLRFGCKDFTYPAYETRPNDPNSYAKSIYIPDETIFSGHPRFQMLSRNLQLRRGERVEIKIKVFEDKNTKLPIEGSPIKEPNVVMLDTSFACNLQVTIQGKNITEARYLYDQLAPLCPIIQAITAAAPIYRGYLTEIDNSWDFIAMGSDERSQKERDNLIKRRWDSIDCYLTPEGEIYNDLHLDYDTQLYDNLRNEGVDHGLAQHVAHLFARDPLLMFNSDVHQNDEEDTGHFDNINTSTWQTLRFKPALPNSDAGWRVEFRPCDVQLTDFENAALSCFVVLLTRVIIHYRLNFLMPISKIDENMVVAQKRNACHTEKFWFRKNIKKFHTHSNGEIISRCQVINGSNGSHMNGFLEHNAVTNGFTNGGRNCHNKELELMSVNEIFNGKSDNFTGLVPLTRSYLQTLELDNDTHCVLEKYLTFIEKRASGEIPTNAMWLREQVLEHPDYKQDSVVSESINYDILKKIKEIQQQEVIASKFFH